VSIADCVLLYTAKYADSLLISVESRWYGAVNAIATRCLLRTSSGAVARKRFTAPEAGRASGLYSASANTTHAA
jgi:hypothetical protein